MGALNITRQSYKSDAAMGIELRKHLRAAKTHADRELYQRQIDAADNQIDALVY